jgi:acyl dehydratase
VKPPLLLRDIFVGRDFNPLFFRITRDLVEKFCDAVGEKNPIFRDAKAAAAAGYPACVAPPGLAGVFGRQAYLLDYSMPPGGVLAEQTIEFHGPALVGDILEVKASVVEIEERKGRHRVTIQSNARHPEGQPVATVRVVAIWPPDPELSKTA